jgi:hypothetical protein
MLACHYTTMTIEHRVKSESSIETYPTFHINTHCSKQKYKEIGVRRGHMVAGFATTCPISAYHH